MIENGETKYFHDGFDNAFALLVYHGEALNSHDWDICDPIFFDQVFKDFSVAGFYESNHDWQRQIIDGIKLLKNCHIKKLYIYEMVCCTCSTCMKISIKLL